MYCFCRRIVIIELHWFENIVCRDDYDKDDIDL